MAKIQPPKGRRVSIGTKNSSNNTLTLWFWAAIVCAAAAAVLVFMIFSSIITSEGSRSSRLVPLSLNNPTISQLNHINTAESVASK